MFEIVYQESVPYEGTISHLCWVCETEQEAREICLYLADKFNLVEFTHNTWEGHKANISIDLEINPIEYSTITTIKEIFENE